MEETDSDDEWEDRLGVLKHYSELTGFWVAERMLKQAVNEGRAKRVRRILQEFRLNPTSRPFCYRGARPPGGARASLGMDSRHVMHWIVHGIASAAARGLNEVVEAFVDQENLSGPTEDRWGCFPLPELFNGALKNGLALAYYCGRRSTHDLLMNRYTQSINSAASSGVRFTDVLMRNVHCMPDPVPLPGRSACNRLRTAAINGNLTMLQRTLTPLNGLELRRVLSTVDDFGRAPLSYAAMLGHEACVRELCSLVSEGVMLNVQDVHGKTPLFLAVLRGHVNVARCLIEAGADVAYCNWILSSQGAVDLISASGHNGRAHSMIHAAVLQGNVDMVCLLIAEVYAWPRHFSITYRLMHALNKAAEIGHCEAAGAVISMMGNHARYNMVKTTALFWAICSGNLTIARMLLRAGANVNHVRSIDKSTALHMAVGGGKRAMLRLLLDYKPSVLDSRDKDGYTVLHLCVRMLSFRLAVLCLQAGADKHLYVDPQPNACRGTASTLIELEVGAAMRENDESSAYLGIHRLIVDFQPSLSNLCIRCIRQCLPTPLTDELVAELPLPLTMQREILFRDGAF